MLESVGGKGTSHCREQYVDSLETKNRITIWSCRGFPDSSAGKEFACNAGDPCSIPGLGRSPGKGIGYLLQYSWTSLLAQMIKNPPVGFWAWSLVGKIPWRRESQSTQYFCLENPQAQTSSVGYSPWGHKELNTTEQLSLSFQKTHAPKVHCSTIYNSQDMEGITFLFGVKQISLQCELLCSASSCFSSLQHSNFLSVASLEGRLSVLLCLTS